jgi:flagellar hook-basal body complex protein FliE
MLPIGSVDISSLIQNPERLTAAKNAAALDADTITQGVGAATAASPAAGTAAAGASDAGSFSNVLANAVQEVNSTMTAADVAKQKLMTGETGNVHQAMIAVQESSVAFSLMVEVRNKLVDSYQELMRMQV